jgi:hypothetical protein
MYPRNAGTPPRIAVGAVVKIADGEVQTSDVLVKVTPEGGAAGASAGTISYVEGIVHYAPTQAETNYTAFTVVAYKADCFPASTTVVTGAGATAGKVTVGTNEDKTAYKLAADGLDSVTASVTGVATTFPAKIEQLWRRFFKKADRTATAIQTYADNGTTVLTEQAISDSEGTETQGAATNPE